MERWLACARRAFAELDPDGDGVAQADDIVACLRAKLPPSEVPPLACAHPHLRAPAQVHEAALRRLPSALLCRWRVADLPVMHAPAWPSGVARHA